MRKGKGGEGGKASIRAQNRHRHQTADGLESATTVDISNSARTHGEERQDMALRAAGRCVHGAKNNRIPTSRPLSGTVPPQRVSNHITMTRTTRITKTNVTRERGMPFTPIPPRRPTRGAAGATR